jgi:N-acetyl-1-D-myo-inositol-2-amino-2-deoxy-alpha-D-glucopyranoside deacetylase
VARQAGDSSDLTGRTVLAVFAHPDDESLACGGTLARLADAGVRVVLFCASRGEKGSVSDPALIADGDLGTVRTKELHEAAKVLGIAEVIIGDQPDGDLRWARIHYLHVQIVSAVRRCRPDAVITFAEDGLYWHLDHIGVHERTYTALGTLGAGAPPLYYVTMPPGIMHEVVTTAIAKGWVPAHSSFWGIAPEAFGDAVETPTLIVDVGDWVPRKLAALRCHRTQMGPTNPFARIDQAEARRWLGVEHFRRAPGSAAAAVLECIGEPVASS